VAVADCWQNPAMSAVLLERGLSPATDADRSNNCATTLADVSCLLGRSDNKHEAVERWRQRKAEKREKRLQKFQIRCGAAPLGGEQTDVQHGCYHLSVSSVSASSISSFGRSLRKSSIHSPLTDRGTLSEDAMFTMSLRLQIPGSAISMASQLHQRWVGQKPHAAKPHVVCGAWNLVETNMARIMSTTLSCLSNMERQGLVVSEILACHKSIRSLACHGLAQPLNQVPAPLRVAATTM